MFSYFVLIFALVAALLFYRARVLARFDQDPAQHRLAELLVAVAARRHGTGEADVQAWLDQIAHSPRNRRARVIHAVLLARKTAAPQLYVRVVELSRRLR